MKVSEAFEKSIATAVENGALDTMANAAPIEAARRLAQVMDDPDWPQVNGKIDNVSPSVFLRYCEALGLTPNADAKPATPKPVGKVSLVSLRADERSRKAAECC